MKTRSLEIASGPVILAAVQCLSVATFFFTMPVSNGHAASDRNYCLSRYVEELSNAKNLVKGEDLAPYYQKRKDLYIKYFEMDPETSPDIMAQNQHFVDIWEAYERGIIDFYQAGNQTLTIQKNMEESPLTLGPMKSCK